MSLARNEVCGRLSIIKFKLSSSLVIKSIALKCLAWIAWFCAIFALKLRGFCFAGFDFSLKLRLRLRNFTYQTDLHAFFRASSAYIFAIWRQGLLVAYIPFAWFHPLRVTVVKACYFLYLPRYLHLSIHRFSPI